MGMAERIKERRIFMGYTQEELGKKLGLQKSAIAKYENGRVENIKRSVIANMANVLECSPSYLLGWADEISRQEESPEIFRYYESLNTCGKQAATEHVRLLTLDDKYTRPDNVASIVREPDADYLAPDAAHSREGADAADQEYDDKEIMDNDALWKK